MKGARDLAARVLVRVEKENAFAAAALEAELARATQLEARDRGLATELVYGTLRVAPWLEAQIERFAPRGTRKLDARVRANLLLAAYQLFFMRVPAFAAVNEAVQAVSEARGARVAAFANAVLRKVATQAGEARGQSAAAAGVNAGGASRADGERDGRDAALLEEAIVASTPPWLRDALERSLGVEGARAFLRCSVDPPAIALRLEASGDPVAVAAARDAWIATLRAAVPEASIEPGQASPLAILVRGAGKPQRLPGFAEGAWSVQEEGSQLAALAVGARPGETILDACAGRGNKTSLLVRAVGETGAVDACDVSPAKLERLAMELARVKLHVRASFAVDWSVGSGEVTGIYDRVLVDAPCSGAGTLRRRPEIAGRRQPEDLDALARSQRAIVRRVAAHVRPGGSLVYVVCSVLREEGEAVIDALLAGADGDALEGFVRESADVKLLPHVHGTDGYFIANLLRR
jgi:16S rRNA (cytosine967-C5)-methyltransferase